MKYRLSGEKVTIFSYFLGLIAIGTALLLLPFSWKGSGSLRFIDALFTATSAVCVTGLSTVSTADFSRFGQVVILALIESGGLGLIAFMTLYVMLPRRKLSLVGRGIIREYSIEEVSYDPKSIIRSIIVMTLLIEALGAFGLYFAFKRQGITEPGYTAVFHAISAFCNAGFSTFPDSLERFTGNPTINGVVCLLIVLGGLGFVVMDDIRKRIFGKKRRLSFYTGTVLRTSGALLVIGFAAFLIFEWNGAYRSLRPGERFIAAAFQSVTPRTAGFDTVAQGLLGPASLMLTLFLMMVGGSSGSTAGGIKTSTLYIIAMLTLKGTDEANDSLVVRNRAIPRATIIKAVRILLKSLLVMGVATMVVAVLEAGSVASGDVTIPSIVFEVVSAFGTVGLSLGLTASLGAASKVVIVLTMFMGRIGLVAMSLPVPGKGLEKYADFASADHIVG